MAKAVLLSIQPKWCELIASGKKTVEVRKTRPKLETPFKVYIYCTTPCTGSTEDRFYIYLPPYDTPKQANGKVIGEFVCDEITPLFNVATTSWNLLAGNVHEYAKALVRWACLAEEEMHSYANGKNCYAWHISDLVIYDKPRSLGEFYHKCEEMPCEGCEHLKYQRVNANEYDYDCEYLNCKIPIRKPPRSWCYVEEVQNDVQ